MSTRRHQSGHLAVVIAVLGFVALGIGLPIVVGGSDRLELHGASLVAAPRDRYEITEPMSLQGVPGLRVERGILFLSEKSVAKALTGEAVTALLASGTAGLVLENAVIVLDSDVDALPDPPAEVMAPLAAVLGEVGFETLSIRRSSLIFKGRDGRTDIIGDVNAEVTAKRRSAIVAKGFVTARGHKLTLEAALGLPTEKRGTAVSRQQPLKVHLKGPLLEASFDGRVAPGETTSIQGQSELAVRNVRDVARWIGLGWPSGPGLTDLRIKGPVALTGTTMAFQKASMQMDGNEASGTLSVSFAGNRPSIGGTLALQTLDLSRYVKAWRSEATRTLIEDVIGPGPFALPMVRLLDADIRISANRVRTGGAELGQSAATLSIKKGKLLADIAEVAIDGTARGSGQLVVDTNAPQTRYVFRGKFADVDFAKLAPVSTGPLPVQGRGDMTADIAATGDTATDLLRTLSGKLALTMPAGGRVGVDVKALLSAAQKQPVQGWSSHARGTTTVESLQSRLVLSEGIIYTESFSAALADGLLTATGGGNLRNGFVDVRLSMAARPNPDKSTASAATVQETIVLRGPWNEPSIRADRPLAAPITTGTAPAAVLKP